HQVELAEKAGGAVADDLVARGVEDRRLALEDRDERIARVADPVEDLPGGGRPLLAERRERLELRGGEDRADAGHARERTQVSARAARAVWRRARRSRSARRSAGRRC